PQGIFVNGTHFHPRVFLSTIHEIYEKVIIEGGNGADLEMEYQAFAAIVTTKSELLWRTQNTLEGG
ncbi:hypothetical protein SERLA73DRAFT_137769, partial [Serpula lacrymans var. lacrymans S7.3]